MSLPEKKNSQIIKQRPLRIALCGLGTVGRGLVTIINENQKRNKSSENDSQDFQIVFIFDRSIDKKRDIIGAIKASDKVEEIFENEFDILVECIGGIDLPLYIIREALDRDIPVVSANKALLAQHGYALFYKSIEQNIPLYFEAAIAGAVPIVRNLKDILRHQEIPQMQGILNGTTNYILTRMRREKKDYAQILLDAQKLGLAEADPHLDVSGIDACQKLALLTSIITRRWVDYHKIYCRGIEQITLADINWAEKLDLRLRLIAKAIQSDVSQEYFLSVEPTLIGKDHFLWDVEFENNAVSLDAQFSKNHLFVGKGAGSLPTAYSIYSDLILYQNTQSNQSVCDNVADFNYAALADLTQLEEPYYLRLRVADEKGVLAKLSEEFSKHDISLSRVHQDELDDNKEGIDVVIVTHPVNRKAMLEVFYKLSDLNFILSEPMLLPVAES